VSLVNPLTPNNGLSAQTAVAAPSLYAAASSLPLNQNQATQINNISSVVGLNQQLAGLSAQDAQKKYQQLDPQVQQQLKSFYGEAPYMQQGQKNFFVRAAGDVLGAVVSPFKAAFKTLGDYGKVINVPYLLGREMTQGDPLSWKSLKTAWDGTEVYDNGSLAQLHKKYGDTDTFVAMNTLDGLTPGKIIEKYGTVNSDILGSIAKMMDKPSEFNSMLNDFKAAQVSPGRDLARVMFSAQPTDNKLHSGFGFRMLSGTLDAAYEILHDPLTWLTGGTDRAVMASEKLGNALAAGTKTVEEAFARGDVRRTWDNVAGPLIEKLAGAREAGDVQAAATARNAIKTQLPAMSNDNLLNEFASAKLFNADAAKNYFSKAEPMTKLLAGSTDSTEFFRTGVPIAKRTHELTSWVNATASKVFNGTATEEEANKFPELMNDIHGIGSDRNQLFTEGIFNADPMRPLTTQGLTDQTQQLASTRLKIGRFMARFPGNTPIGVFDEQVDKSMPALRGLGRLIYPKTFADYFAEAYRQSVPADRVILLRGLYTQIMHNMGLHATEQGQTLMENILKDKFGDQVGYMNQAKIGVPGQFKDELRSGGIVPETADTKADGEFQYYHGGPIHNYQPTTVIGSLPWGQLSDYGLYIGKNARAREIIQSSGAHTARAVARKGVNQWSWLTLFPRLGIRASLDEAMFYSLSAQGRDLYHWGLGKNIGKVVTAFTGDEKQIPPVKRAILNWLDKNPAKALEDADRVKTMNINGEERFILDDKENIVKNLQNYLEGVLPKGKAVVDEEHQRVTYPHQEKLINWVTQMLVHTDGAVSNALINSSIGKSSIEALNGGDFSYDLTSKSALTRAMKELGFTSKGKYDMIEANTLDAIHGSYVAMAHFKNFYLRFLRNAMNYGPKGTYEHYFNPAEIFFNHRGGIAEGDLTKMVDESLGKLSVDTTKMEVTKPDILEKFLQGSNQWGVDKAAGVPPIQAAIKRLEAMYIDMYSTFHGSADKFNHDLYKRIFQDAQGILEESGKKAENGLPTISKGRAIREALKTINFDDFNQLTKFNRPEGKINTDLHFTPNTSNEGFLAKMAEWAKNPDAIGNHPLEWMDAQNQHMFRQPAMWVSYIKYREKYARLEQQYAQELQDTNGWSKEFSTHLAQKKFTEIAMNHASEVVLKTCNNPEVRSNLAWALRTSGRFYRSVEDFYRRVYRLKNATPQLVYRLRLAHMGLGATGFVHNDQNGDPYLLMPADNIIFQALQGPAQVLGLGMKQPMFDDFGLNLTLSNPTLGQDAGMPSLQGPFVGLSVMAVQKMLGEWGGQWGREAATNIDKAVLGSVNQNLTWNKAIIPTSLQRAWDMLSPNEQSQQFTSAAMQAVAYNAAHGIGLTPQQVNAMAPADRAAAISDYLNKIKVTTHNILFLRNFLGFLSPIAPNLQESRDIPSYLKNVGVTGIRSEFADILQATMNASRGEIQDPYGAALMAYTAKYPGRIVYTVARDAKTTQVALSYTKDMKTWLAKYQPLVDGKYGEAALIFAPHVGQYDANAFAWMQNAGLIQSRTLEDYYKEVAIAGDRQKYYDARNQEQAVLNDPNASYADKQYATQDAKLTMDNLKLVNPYLEIALNDKSYGVGKQEDMLNNLQAILKGNDIPMSDGTRQKMKLITDAVYQAVQDIKAINSNPDTVDNNNIKEARKQAVLALVRSVGGAQGNKTPSDPIVAEALKSIFLPVLDYYVRNPSTVQIKTGQ